MKNFGITLSLLLIVLFSACKSDKYPDLKEGMYAEITTNKGVVLALLEFENTPSLVANFVSLATGTNSFVDEKFKNKNFYDGMLFQRNDLVVQVGDPKGEGSGTGYVFEDEFPVDDEGDFLLTHNQPGVLSMANSGVNTNSSQFFITLKEASSLDGKHCVFGRVLKGQDVVNSIVSDDSISTIKIIKKGQKATAFNAAAVFAEKFKKFDKKRKEEENKVSKRNKKAAKAIKQMRNFFRNNKRLAKEYPSGLRMLNTKKGNGKKPKKGSQILIDFAGFKEDGNLFSTSILKTAEIFNMYNEQYDQDNKYRPMEQIYSDKSGLITGLKEGMLKMEYGEKAMLFIPAKLAYGDKGDGYMIEPNTDLVIELEILDKIIK